MEDAAVAVASSAARVVAAVVSPVARDVVAAKVVANSADVDVVVRDVDVAKAVVVEAAVVPRPASTSPIPAPSPAWAHRLRQHWSLPENRVYLHPTIKCG